MAIVLAALAGGAVLAIQAPPAIPVAAPPSHAAVPPSPAANRRISSYILAPQAVRPRRGVAERNRARIPAGPSADLWANVPDLAMSYRTGRRGPVIELGAFAPSWRALPDEQAPFDDASLAHLSLAWNF